MADSKSAPQRWGETAGKAAFYLLIHGVIFYLVILIVFKGIWDVLVPTLFPGAVDQGLVAKSISWWTAFLMAGAVSLVSGWVRWSSGGGFGSTRARDPVLGAKLDAIAKHLGIDMDTVVQAEVAALARAGRKIEAIALYRGHTGAALARAKAYVDSLESSERRDAEHGGAGD